MVNPEKAQEKTQSEKEWGKLIQEVRERVWNDV
jgi:hypothetical protein